MRGSSITATFLAGLTLSHAHHMRQPAVHTVNQRDSELTLRVTNKCPDNIHPALLTQSGTPPNTSGFLLTSGTSRDLTVSADWQGRIWGRTNCSFDQNGKPQSGQGERVCTTGDCGQFLQCEGAALAPATLAEFTMLDSQGHTYYDVSLVDGYNLPMAIKALAGESTDPNLQAVPPNLSNPVCIGTSSLFSSTDDASDQDVDNTTYPTPLEQSLNAKFVQSWCPFPLLLLPPQRPGDGVYPYPDDNIQRPIFSPCLSACARWNKPQYCCTGKHNDPDSCKPNFYATQAKKVCPDAYSYAYDDQSSTFTMPTGLGYEVIFCPKGRSSNILGTLGDQMRGLTQNGRVTRDIDEIARNKTYIAEKNEAMPMSPEVGKSLAGLVVLIAWLCWV